MKKFGLFICMLAAFQCAAFAEITIKGNVDSYHALQVKNPHSFMSSSTHARVDTQFTTGNALALVSVKGEKNSVVESETGFELREAYAEYATEKWEVRAGRQLIIWGRADGFQITDIVCPKDYTEFLARDFDEMRLPVDAVKSSLLFEYLSIQFIWLPVFQSAEYPGNDSPWKMDQYEGKSLVVNNYSDCEPQKRIKNSEAGGKMSFYLPGVDLAFSYFYTWDDSPSLHSGSLSGDTLSADMKYHRLSFYGAEFSIPAGDFVIRGETAFFTGRYYETEGFTDEPLKRNNLKALLGVDWTPGCNWTISVQLHEDHVFDYDEDMKAEKDSLVSTLRIEKKLLRERLVLTTMAFYGFNDNDVFDRTSADYALTDSLHFLAGFDIFAGDEDGEYGRYKDNTEVWVRAKYSF